jgi:hypothetical protein
MLKLQQTFAFYCMAFKSSEASHNQGDHIIVSQPVFCPKLLNNRFGKKGAQRGKSTNIGQQKQSQ